MKESHVRPRLLAFTFALAFCTVGWLRIAFCSSPEPPGIRPQVTSVEIEGTGALASDRIKKILTTRGKRFHIFDDVPLDEKALEEDIERIEKFYQSEGFYHARVVSHEIVPTGGNHVRVVIRVEEGQPMIVSRIDFHVDGDTSGSLRKELLSALPLQPGERFSTPAYRDCEKVILKKLADDGYPKARIDMKARLDKLTHLGEVTIDVLRGPECRFGPVTIEGNRRVNDTVIVRELRFKQEERFMASKIVESQRRLFNTRLFQFVDLSVLAMEGSESELPIHIVVKEAKKQTVRVGMGYGTEEQLRAKMQYEIRNFLGDGRELQIHSKASSLMQLVEGNFIQPYFLGMESTWSTEAGWTRMNEASFENSKFFVTPRIAYNWTDELASYVGYNLEANRLLSIDTQEEAKFSTDRENEEYYVSSIVEGISWERVDDALNPRSGFRIIQALEWASIALGSEVDYIKLSLETRGYLPVSKYGVLAARLKWGGIKEMENTKSVPIFKRFFSGGSNSVRGYPYQRLGPLDEEGEPIGGLSLVEGNLDYRFPLPIEENLEGVLFFDFGNVFEESYKLIWENLRYSVGMGIRYQTPVGPVRLDIGYQLNPPDQDFFNRYEIHFSIGQAF